MELAGFEPASRALRPCSSTGIRCDETWRRGLPARSAYRGCIREGDEVGESSRPWCGSDRSARATEWTGWGSNPLVPCTPNQHSPSVFLWFPCCPDGAGKRCRAVEADEGYGRDATLEN